MIPVTVQWATDWSDVPFVDPAECSHPSSAAMAIGLSLERNRGRVSIATTGVFCMLCGIDSSGRLSPDDVLEAAWLEHGWHAATGERILAFTRRATSTIEGAA